MLKQVQHDVLELVFVMGEMMFPMNFLNIKYSILNIK